MGYTPTSLSPHISPCVFGHNPSSAQAVDGEMFSYHPAIACMPGSSSTASLRSNSTTSLPCKSKFAARKPVTEAHHIWKEAAGDEVSKSRKGIWQETKRATQRRVRLYWDVLQPNQASWFQWWAVAGRVWKAVYFSATVWPWKGANKSLNIKTCLCNYLN